MPILEEEIRSAGFNFIPLGTMQDIQDALNDPNLWHPVRGFEVIAKRAILKYMRPLYEEIIKFDPANTLVITSGMAFGARLAQEKLGYQLLTVHLQSSILMSAHDNAELAGIKLPDWFPPGIRRQYLNLAETMVIDRLLAPSLNRFRKELGLDPVRKIFSQWMNSTDSVLGLFPDWFSPSQPDWPTGMQQTSFVKFETGFQEFSTEASNFLNAGDAPIVFTAGSANAHVQSFFKTAVEATQRLGKRAILLSRFDQHIPSDLPDSVLHAEWVPMSQLLPRSAMIVHHGGIGTTAQALSAGIPQLVTPLAHDQFDNANRLKQIGVGDRLLPRQFTPKRAAAVMNRLLTDPEVQVNAKEISKRVDFDRALQNTGDLIEKFMDTM
jgi:rhamnosyltransferase subunit B